jgi:hypothetical protein
VAAARRQTRAAFLKASAVAVGVAGYVAAPVWAKKPPHRLAAGTYGYGLYGAGSYG